MAEIPTSSKHYYIKDDKCYTEDHILVQELYLYNVPIELNDDEVHQYFKNYGDVVYLRTCYNNGRKSPLEIPDLSNTSNKEQNEKEQQEKTGRVLFARPLDAAKVLLSQKHLVNRHEFHVKAIGSYGPVEPPKDPPEQIDILKIPDDCLVKILKYLPLPDQLQFLRCCARFRDVYNLDTRPLHKSVDFKIFDTLTVWDMREFFFIFGRNIETFQGVIKPRLERFYDYFGKNCVNLKSLKLRSTQLSSRNVLKMFANTSNLENLDLNGCSLTEGSLVALNNLKNLKSLILSHNWQRSGIDLEKLPVSINTLGLFNCRDKMSSYLMQMGKCLPNLKDLNISGIDNIHSDINEYPISIETLRFRIFDKTNYKKIASLPNLKRIYIQSIHSTNTFTQLVDQLLVTKSEQLEQLNIYNAHDITNQMLLKIVKFDKLRKLVLSGSRDIDDDILGAFTKMKNLEHFCLEYSICVTFTGVLRLLQGCPKLKELDLFYCPHLTKFRMRNMVSLEGLQATINKVKNRELSVRLYVGSTTIGGVKKC
ncbi:F-box/LRR-repeat protein 20-like [Drosophila tropicalis]|uniref:F-box/LRR-repeat protein 20-like n=1 Tax=Drosophila tropicalis TaxID=46794 RepID=UPI0035AB9B8E